MVTASDIKSIQYGMPDIDEIVKWNRGLKKNFYQDEWHSNIFIFVQESSSADARTMGAIVKFIKYNGSQKRTKVIFYDTDVRSSSRARKCLELQKELKFARINASYDVFTAHFSRTRLFKRQFEDQDIISALRKQSEINHNAYPREYHRKTLRVVTAEETQQFLEDIESKKLSLKYFAVQKSARIILDNMVGVTIAGLFSRAGDVFKVEHAKYLKDANFHKRVVSKSVEKLYKQPVDKPFGSCIVTLISDAILDCCVRSALDPLVLIGYFVDPLTAVPKASTKIFSEIISPMLQDALSAIDISSIDFYNEAVIDDPELIGKCNAIFVPDDVVTGADLEATVATVKFGLEAFKFIINAPVVTLQRIKNGVAGAYYLSSRQLQEVQVELVSKNTARRKKEEKMKKIRARQQAEKKKRKAKSKGGARVKKKK